MGILYVSTFPAPVLPKNFAIDFQRPIKLRTLHSEVSRLANEEEGLYTAVYRSRRRTYLVLSNLASFLYKKRGIIHRQSEDVVMLNGVRYVIDRPRDYTIYDAAEIDVKTVRNVMVER